MKKQLMLLSVLLIGSLGILAQEPDRAPNPMQILNHFFQFDEDQGTQLQVLFEARQADQLPIFEAIRETKVALREEISSEAPDATIIGELILEEKALKEQVRAIYEGFSASFGELLTEEQTQKYFALVRAERLIPVVKAAKAVNLPLIPQEQPAE